VSVATTEILCSKERDRYPTFPNKPDASPVMACVSGAKYTDYSKELQSVKLTASNIVMSPQFWMHYKYKAFKAMYI
jgi:hypothetical protein